MTDYSKIHLRDDVHQTLCYMREGFNILRDSVNDKNIQDLTIAGTVELLLAKGRLTREDVMDYQPVSRTGRPRHDAPAPTWMNSQRTVDLAVAKGRIPGSTTPSTVSEEQLDAESSSQTDSSETTSSGGGDPDNHTG